MKIIRSFIVLGAFAALFALASCGQNTTDPENNVEEQKPQGQEKPKLEPGDFKFIAPSAKGEWEAGDCIYVHGSLGTNIQLVTLTEDNISATDRSVATAYLGDVTKWLAKPDGLYAAWPAENVYKYVGSLDSRTTFLDYDGPRAAAYLDGDTFRFKDVTCLLSFKVSGGFDRFALCSNSRSGMGGFSVMTNITSESSDIFVTGGNGYPFLSGDLGEDGEYGIWFPSGLKFPDGYSIFLGKNGSWDHIYKTTASLTLSGGVVDLGTIEPVAYDGPAPVLPTIAGKPSKKTVSGLGELSDVCLSENGDFLWGVDDDGYLGKISFEGELLDYHYVISDPEDISLDPRNGNLLIGMETPGSVGIVYAPVTATSKGKKLFDISPFSSFDNDGLEGLTYYKDNMVFAGAQSGPTLVLCDLDGTLLWKTVLPYKNPVSEIAGLCYDPLTNWLWLIDSETKLVYVYIVNAEAESETKWNVSLDYLGAYPVREPGNPEGVCVDHARSCLWVTDDYSRKESAIYRYDMEGLNDFIIN